MNTLDFSKRPLSWSSISQFRDYSKEVWFDKYIKGERTPENSSMTFGKLVGDRLAREPSYLPDVPRGSVYEYELRASVGGINMIGFIDSYCPERKLLLEYKTAAKPWDQERANNHGQLKMYSLMLYLLHDIKPEDLTIKLVSLQTEARGDFTMTFVKDMKPDIFEVKLTTRDVLKFGAEIIKIAKEMKEYVEGRQIELITV